MVWTVQGRPPKPKSQTQGLVLCMWGWWVFFVTHQLGRPESEAKVLVGFWAEIDVALVVWSKTAALIVG